MRKPPFILRGPQFEREPGATSPAAPPADAAAWAALRTLERGALLELGLRPWNDPSDLDDVAAAGDYGGRVLMLLPGEWYRHVPDGYALTCISGELEHFKAGTTDDDIRFGCLAYGLLVNP